jgi:hypothetical protein
MISVLALVLLTGLLANQAYAQGAILRPAPEPHELTGEHVDRLTVGHQVILTSDIRINTDVPTPYVIILEIRDSNGFSTFIGWRSGTVAGQGTVSYGMSWIPENTGLFQIRHYVVTNMTNPVVLEDLVTVIVEVF